MSVFSRSVVAQGEAAYIDAGQEDSVPDGLYWRVTPGGATDLPAGPILLRHIPVDRPLRVESIDASTRQPPVAGLRVTPDAPVLLLPRTPQGAMIGWALVQGEGDLRVAAISGRVAVGGAYVEVSARDREPYAVAAHDMAGLVVSGDGRIIESSFFALPTEFAADIGDIPGEPQVHTPPDDCLPLRGYCTTAMQASWKDRITLAAPRRAVPYALVDPNGPWSPDDEFRRADEMARLGPSVDDWLRTAYDALGSDTRGLIAAANGDAGDPYRVVAAQTAAAALSIGALDPGIARWLGRSGMLPHGLVGAPWHGVLWATVPLHLYLGRLPVGVTLTDNATDDEIYDDRIGAGGAYLDLLNEVAGWPPHAEFGAPAIVLAHIPMPYSAGVIPARPVQPVLVPSPFGPRWAPDEPRRWEQTVAIGSPPKTAYALRGPVPRSPVALLRTDPQSRTLHPEIEGTGLAAPLLPGWDDSTGASTVTAGQDAPVDAPAVPVTWSIALSDWVGRWGEPAVIAQEPPGPLPPAPPTIDAGLARQTSAGAAAASPGVVHVRFRVPTTTVPGALPLQRITWRTDGAGRPPLDLAGAAAGAHDAALLAGAEFPAPATVPGQHRRITIAAEVEDVAGNASGTVTFDIDVSDARALRPPTVAPHMLVTSRRTGDPNVSVALTVRAPSDGCAYRFYLASESALRTAAHLGPLTGATRAVRAQRLSEQNPATARAASMPATPEPAPVIGGTATARIDVPAGTADVLAVRAVPVAAELDAAGRVVRDGVEPPFTSVKPVFVVVPYDDVPPTPELTLTRAGDAGAGGVPVTATVVVRGVQATVLNRYARQPIQARFVEASTDGDPWYWPQIAIANLSPSPTDASVFTGAVTLGLPEWSRAGIAVAVRYPPEDLVVPNADVVVQPELTATGPQGDRIESPWGPVSVPAWIEINGPEPLVTAQSDGVGGPVHVQAFGIPRPLPGTPPFVLHVYSAATGAMLEVAAGEVTHSKPELIVNPLDLGGLGAQFGVAFETPFGALLPPVFLSA